MRELPITRECGKCTACCTVMSVPDIQKPEHHRCEHLTKKGCAIYAERPNGCRVFFCAWLLGLGERGDRPDQSGIVVDQPAAMSETKVWRDVPYYVVRPTRPGAEREHRAYTLIQALSNNAVVLVMGWNGKRRLLGPPDLVHEIVRRVKESGGPAAERLRETVISDMDGRPLG